MGPSKSPARHRKNQVARRRKRRAWRPRRRTCLLKGCEQKFHPRQARQRYCSEPCRGAARKWSRWKAQKRYRETGAGQEKRNGQSQRYRERVKTRKPAQPKALNEAARVITQEHFFRTNLRSAGLLRAIRAPAAKSVATLLLPVVPTRFRASYRAGATVETGAHLVRTY